MEEFFVKDFFWGASVGLVVMGLITIFYFYPDKKKVITSLIVYLIMIIISLLLGINAPDGNDVNETNKKTKEINSSSLIE